MALLLGVAGLGLVGGLAYSDESSPQPPQPPSMVLPARVPVLDSAGDLVRDREGNVVYASTAEEEPDVTPVSQREPLLSVGVNEEVVEWGPAGG